MITNNDRFLRLREVMSQTGLSRSKIYREIKDEKFPAQKKHGRSSLWVESEIWAWKQAVIRGDFRD